MVCCISSAILFFKVSVDETRVSVRLKNSFIIYCLRAEVQTSIPVS